MTRRPRLPVAFRTPVGKVTIALVLVVLAVIVFAGAAYVSNRNRIIQSNERADCRSRVGSDFGELREARTKAENEAVNFFLHTALTHTPAGTPLSDDENRAITAKVDAADDAQRRVDEAGKVNDAIDFGYTIDGVHHRPCPALD